MSNLRKRLKRLAGSNFILKDVSEYAPEGVMIKLSYTMDSNELKKEIDESSDTLLMQIYNAIVDGLTSNMSFLTKYINGGNSFGDISGKVEESFKANDSKYFDLSGLNENNIETLTNEDIAKRATRKWIEDSLEEFELGRLEEIDEQNKTCTFYWG